MNARDDSIGANRSILLSDHEAGRKPLAKTPTLLPEFDESEVSVAPAGQNSKTAKADSASKLDH